MSGSANDNSNKLNLNVGCSSSPIFHSSGWCPPPSSSLKLNVDASISSHSSVVGLGVVLRNDLGLVMWSCCMQSLGSSKVLCAEANALLMGISMAHDLGFHSVIIESDALGLVQLINSDSFPLSEIDYNVWMKDIPSHIDLLVLGDSHPSV
ncbi:hypothetical protein ACOSQ3_001936 [Xanthoceras sorbifolium]